MLILCDKMEADMTVEECKAWWEKEVSTSYFKEFQYFFSQPQLIKRFNLLANSAVLEVGFGYGRELSQFCKISNNVHGVDIAQSAAKVALIHLKAQGVENMPCLKSYDGRHLPFEDKKFDLVYGCFVVQHMSKQAAEELIKESLRVLKNSGRILFEFFREDAFLAGEGKNAYSFAKEGGTKMYNNGYTKEEIKKLAEKTGVKIDWIHIVQPAEEIVNYWVCMRK